MHYGRGVMERQEDLRFRFPSGYRGEDDADRTHVCSSAHERNSGRQYVDFLQKYPRGHILAMDQSVLQRAR